MPGTFSIFSVFFSCVFEEHGLISVIFFLAVFLLRTGSLWFPVSAGDKKKVQPSQEESPAALEGGRFHVRFYRIEQPRKGASIPT